ncbi:MAG: hypothetical protein ABF751_09870 [Acetobacter orientalis]|uniref:hypothetical protein n=1 Tax=Acetobacter TaxID=434 RepID=UPI0039ECEC90
MKNQLTTPDIYALLNRKVNEARTAKDFAVSHGFTEAYLSAVRNGVKPIPLKESPLTRALGVEWVPPTGGYWRFREDV